MVIAVMVKRKKKKKKKQAPCLLLGAARDRIHFHYLIAESRNFRAACLWTIYLKK
jgi:hypothetical protein